MRNPFRRKALTGTPAVLEALANRQLNPYPLLGGGARQRINALFTKAQSANYVWMYGNSPAVRTVVDILASNVGQLDLRLYEEIDEAEREARPNHPAAYSVRYPNQTTTSDLWVRQMVTDFLIFKNAYSLKFRNPANGRISFEYIPAQHMEVVGQLLFRPEGYRYRRPDGVPVDITNPDDVFHWRDANPDDPRMGFSPLETLRGAIAEDAALEGAIVELAKSGLVSPSWVYRPLDAPVWSNEARERFEEDLTNRLRRATKTPPVMEEGMELRDVGVSPRNAQMLEVRKWVLQKVASLYGVPLGMVGLDDNLKDARAQFYADTLPPLCESFTRALNLSLLVNEYNLPAYCFEFDVAEKMRGDEREKALVSASGRPVRTTNEARALLNLSPIEGGDELVTPLNVVVGENPKPSTDLMPIQDPNKPPQDGSYREEDKQLEVKAAPELAGAAKVTPTYGRKSVALYATDLTLKAGGHPKIGQAMNLKDVDDAQVVQLLPRLEAERARQFRAVDKCAGVLTTFYGRLGRSMRAKSWKGLDQERWSRELGDDLHKRLKAIFEAEADLYIVRLAGEGPFDMGQVEHWLEAAAYGSAGALVEHTDKEIDKLGAEEAIRHALEGRISVAAASLGSGVIRKARQEAAQQAPHPERRMQMWVANTARHGNLGGAMVPLGQTFGGVLPGQPANCKCTLSVV